MCETLLSNPAYQTIGPLCQEVMRQSDLLTRLRGAKGNIDMIEVQLLSDAKRARLTGTDVVSYTFLLYCLKQKAPTIEDLKVRKDPVMDCVGKVKAKVTLTDKYDCYVKALTEGKDTKLAMAEYASIPVSVAA